MNPKFFKENIYNKHLDIRFSQKCNINKEETLLTLQKLLIFFTDYCKKNNIKPIIMHGSLIGYYFNKKILPWDDDIDIIITGDCIFNMKNEETDDYMVEVNPYSIYRNINDINNKIDARIISKKNGLFIDITYFIEDYTKKYIWAKDKHFYRKVDIFPLQKSIFCDCEVYTPSNIKNCLIKEYDKKVLLPKYKNWIFNHIKNKWEKII